MGEAAARDFVETFERSFEEKFDQHRDTLATKTDIANLKAELMKWMFIFWTGSVVTTAGVVFALISAYLRH